LELLDLSKEAIGKPDVMFCMDSGAMSWDQLWMTSSLRGIICIDVQVEAAKGGYHSGEVGGIVPETARIMRQLLDRIDDSKSGMCIEALNCEIPEFFKKEAENISAQVGNTMYEKYNVNDGVQCMNEKGLAEMYLNNTWRANMSVVGAGGFPAIQTAGNVVRPMTSFRLSIRLPPKVNPTDAYKAVNELMTTDVPYNAKVTTTSQGAGQGWCMGTLSPWLEEGICEAGKSFWDGKPAGSYGMGGSIPFLAELEKMYPETQIVAFGLIGPGTNAHAPDECINLPFAKKLTCALSHVMGVVGQN